MIPISYPHYRAPRRHSGEETIRYPTTYGIRLSLLATAAASALSACVAPSAICVPAVTYDRAYPTLGLDVGGFRPPPLDPAESLAVTLHVLPPSAFEAAAAAHGTGLSRAFTVFGTHPCEVYIQATDVTPGNWTVLGSIVNHEMDHCEGWHHAGEKY